MKMADTEQQFLNVVANCRALFEKKQHDYGASWRIMRPESLTDQIFIKVQRIRSLERTGVSRVDEGIEGEFVAIVNYGLMALIQLKLGTADSPEMDEEEALRLYDEQAERTLRLMLDKNHDYDEAWRQMRVSSIADLILMKVYRTKQIEDLEGNTLVSEGVEGNYFDMINYAIFALILLTS